ncbi:hypothetical protein [Methanospirillum sp.]|uniref:hypothetical protein n=1 Tax=Methanospirillum sp. TaxID=45200 RepID=UPI002982F431|nr:hypothetical protein [Methanospirillum sp.]
MKSHVFSYHYLVKIIQVLFSGQDKFCYVRGIDTFLIIATLVTLWSGSEKRLLQLVATVATAQI